MTCSIVNPSWSKSRPCSVAIGTTSEFNPPSGSFEAMTASGKTQRLLDSQGLDDLIKKDRYSNAPAQGGEAWDGTCSPPYFYNDRSVERGSLLESRAAQPTVALALERVGTAQAQSPPRLPEMCPRAGDAPAHASGRCPDWRLPFESCNPSRHLGLHESHTINAALRSVISVNATPISPPERAT